MNRCLTSALLLAACSKSTPAVTTDAAPPAPPPAPAPLAVSTEKLHLVATTRPNVKIDSLALHGDSVWVAASDGEWAFAAKVGALEKVLPPTQGLTLKPSQRAQVVGVEPHLFALVTEEIRGRDLGSRVFVRHVEDRQRPWHEVADLGFNHRPVAFLPFRDGAMAISSIVDPARTNRVDPYKGNSRATTLTFIAKDDTFSRRDDLLDGTFAATGGAADRTGISILGSVETPDSPAPGATWSPFGTHLHQIDNEEETRRTALQTYKQESIIPSFMVYRNNGLTTVSAAGPMNESELWRPNYGTPFVVDGTAAKRPRVVPGDASDRLFRARMVGGVLYAIREHANDAGLSTRELLRVPDRGPATIVELPPAGGDACEALEIGAGYDEDLWIRATCGPDRAAAVFRRGGPEQKSVEL